jgi:hypothetical protein
MCGRSRSWRRYELRHGAVPVGETEVSESAEGELGGDEGQHAPSEAGARAFADLQVPSLQGLAFDEPVGC